MFLNINEKGEFNWFNIDCVVDDVKGINADSAQGFINKIRWCKDNDIYQNCRYPVNSYTVHMLLFY